MNETVLTIIFVISVTALCSYFSFRQKKSSWQGVLIDKKVNHDDESGTSVHYLIFQTDKGKKKVNLSSASAEYDKWTIGDKAKKVAGEYFPQKIT